MHELRYKDGDAILSVCSLLGSMTGEAKADLIARLACDDDVIKMVADQIIHGCTDDGSCGSSYVTAHSDDSMGSPLDRAQRAVALAAGDVARREIDRLKRELAHKEHQIAEMYERESSQREHLGRFD